MRIPYRARNDDGFTIVESIVALVIIFGLLLVMLRSFDTGVRVLVETKRQAAASAFASELMERARSLEWEHMGLTADANGTDCPDDVGCPTILAELPEVGTVGADYAFGGEPIVFTNGQAFDPFLSFHQQVIRDDTVFDRYLFVTSVRDDPLDPETERYRRLTAIVRWTSQTGFPEEVRLVSYMSEFVAPSQPLIQGQVSLDGGAYELEGWFDGTALWGSSADPTKQRSLTVKLPDGTLRATTDYVAGATARVLGMAATHRFAGPDGLLFTADDVVSELETPAGEKLADDDATSAAPLNDTSLLPISMPRFVFSNSNERVVELDEDGTVPTYVADPDDLTWTAEVWTKHDPNPVAPVEDALPFGTLTIDSAAVMATGFVEYDDPAVRTLYDTWQGVLIPDTALSLPAYVFEPVRYGDTNAAGALTYQAQVDRYDDPVTERRKITVDYTWGGEDLYLLSDTVTPAAKPSAGDFKGWVWIELPTVTGGSLLEAGEDAWPNPTVDVTSDLRVHFWNPKFNRYDRVFDNYSGLICDPDPVVLTLAYSVPDLKDAEVVSVEHPNLTFVDVSGTIIVYPICNGGHQEYTTGEIAANRIFAGTMVTGELHYQVEDTLAWSNLPGKDGTLFNYTLSFDVGGVEAAAIYLNPELELVP